MLSGGFPHINQFLLIIIRFVNDHNPFSLFLGLTQSFKILLARAPFLPLITVLLLALIPLISRQIYLQGLEVSARRHTSVTVTVTFHWYSLSTIAW